MAKQQKIPALRLRIDLSPEHAIGPGKVALLERLSVTGSLSQAARELGMSYRRAWLLLDDLNHAFAEPVASATVGGAGGGGAQLTPFGQTVIDAYRDIERKASEVARERLAWLAGQQARSSGKTSAVRRPLSRSARKSVK